MACYMKFDGINGGVTAQDYEGLVELTTVDFGLGRGVAMRTGMGGNRESTAPSFSEVRMTKVLDAPAANNLLMETINGAGKGTCTLYFVKTDGDSTQCFLELEFSGAMFTSLTTQYGGGEVTYAVTMAYTKLQQKNMERDADNALGAPDIAGYDLALAAKA